MACASLIPHFAQKRAASMNRRSHMVFVATGHNLDVREVLKHPLGLLPSALSNCDGTFMKTSKPTIARPVERRVAPAESIPLPSACIIDGMRLVNKIRGDNRTFGDIAESIYMIAIQSGNDSSRKDIVFMSKRQLNQNDRA